MQTENAPILVSVVIRNRDEAEHLQYVLQALKKQRYENYEIIVVDNNSNDESVELAENAGAKVVTIHDFSYGKALNLGVNASQGKIIVILSAHSIPLGHYFLTECVEAFKDSRVGAARLVYVGKENDMTRWLNVEVLNDVEQDFNSKGPLASGCVIRREAWEKVQFDEEAEAAEDKIWAAEILKRGYLILTPIPAFYYYRKRLDAMAEMYKNYREVNAIHEKFGIRVGFIKRSGYQALIDLIYGILVLPQLAGKKIHFEMVRAYLRFRFPGK